LDDLFHGLVMHQSVTVFVGAKLSLKQQHGLRYCWNFHTKLRFPFWQLRQTGFVFCFTKKFKF